VLNHGGDVVSEILHPEILERAGAAARTTRVDGHRLETSGGEALSEVGELPDPSSEAGQHAHQTPRGRISVNFERDANEVQLRRLHHDDRNSRRVIASPAGFVKCPSRRFMDTGSVRLRTVI
jgi:hypothetical protein